MSGPPRPPSQRHKDGVWIEPKGIRVRYWANDIGSQQEGFIPYPDLREASVHRRSSPGSGGQLTLIGAWMLAWILLIGQVFPRGDEGLLLFLLLGGIVAVPVWAHKRARTYLTLEISGGHLAGLRRGQQGHRLVLSLGRRTVPFYKDPGHELVAKISQARREFFQRIVTETDATVSGGASSREMPRHRAAVGSPGAGSSKELPSRLDLKEELGRGGMATVYRARDQRLGREVAVKVLHESLLSDEEAVARFEREAKLIAGLEHPNLLSIYGVERLGEGRLGLVMPYVRGGTLRDLIRSTGGEGLEPDAVTRITRETLKGLAFAHRRGVVHRDIKPGNIFLEQETNRVLIGDFGIARAAEGHTALTQTGTSMGTPNYMAPEQIDSSSEVDGRADLYAVGMLMWEMVTGEQPWGQESLFNVIFKQKTEDLRTPRSRRGPVPDHLLAVWRKATRKDPDDRWATAEEMLEALSRPEPLGRTGSGPDSTQPEPGGGGDSVVREEGAAHLDPSRDTDYESPGSDTSPAPEDQPTWKWDG